MKKNLILFNLLLAVLAVLLGYQLRSRWVRYQSQHDVALLNPKAGRTDAGEKSVAAAREPSNYTAIVDNHLFSSDRNSVIPEDPEASAKPPGLKPILMGTLEFGEEPFALMVSDQPRDASSYKELKVGESLDGYTLVKILEQKVIMSVDGNEVEVRLNEPSKLVARDTGPTPQSSSGNAGRVITVGSSIGSSTGGPAVSTPAKGAIPPGTIVNGKRKIVVPSPFGPMESWEDVK